jgi:aminoglycoside phosphotransferase (APT) family kinase protein
MTADFASALDRALGRTIAGFARMENMRRLSGGASQETWAFDAIVEARTEPLILRRSPGGAERVTMGSHAVPLETEALVIEAARAHSVAAPRVRYVLTPDDGVGHGYVMDRLPGETIARKILRDPEFDAVRPNLARQCGELLARIHGVDIAPLSPALAVTDGPTQLRHYRDLYDAYDYPHPVFEFAFKWLERRMHPAKRQTLVHGDFRHGNLLISPGGVEAALDWELTHIGDPLEDICRICTNSWRFGVAEKVVGGFGDLEDLLAGYEAAGGTRFTSEDVRTWIVYGSL